MNKYHAACLCSIIACSTAPAFAEIIEVVNGNFESAVTTSSDIASSTAAQADVWLKTSSLSIIADNGPSATGSSSLGRIDTGTSTAGTIHERSAYNFIDASGQAGSFRLDFDYKRFQNSGFLSPVGSVNVNVYGIEDTGAAGWTTTQPFDVFLSTTTAVQAPVATPVLIDATLSTLGSFSFSGLDTSWRSDSIEFELGDGSQYDQIVIRAGARNHLNAREVHLFDNFALTQTAVAVPEPTSLVLLGAVAAVGCYRRRRSSKPLSPEEFERRLFLG